YAQCGQPVCKGEAHTKERNCAKSDRIRSVRRSGRKTESVVRQRVRGNVPVWNRSCSTGRHNSVCGERELRGERRGKGGRTWATTPPRLFFNTYPTYPDSALRLRLYRALARTYRVTRDRVTRGTQ